MVAGSSIRLPAGWPIPLQTQERFSADEPFADGFQVYFSLWNVSRVSS